MTVFISCSIRQVGSTISCKLRLCCTILLSSLIFLSAFLWKLPDIVAVVPRSLEAAGRQEDE